MPMSTQTGSSTRSSLERHPLPSHTFCPLIGASCDRKFPQQCGEQNPKRLAMLPPELCSHALKELLRYATSNLGLQSQDVATSGRGDTATIRIKAGNQIAAVTRGTLITSNSRSN